MSTRLQAGQVYLPTGGMCPDKNSLVLNQAEVVSSLNLRNLTDRVQTRGGSRRVATNTPSGDPILHMHTYKASNGTETLFGFTKNCVFKYIASSSSWSYVIPFVTIDECESTTNWTSAISGITVTLRSAGYSGAGIGFSGTYGGVASGDALFVRTGLNLDLTSTNQIRFWYITGGQITLNSNFAIEFYSDVSLTTLIESIPFTIASDGVWYEKILTKSSAGGYATVRGFKIVTAAGGTDLANASTLTVFDHFTATNSSTLFSSFTVNHWSTTDFTDLTYANTVIAAGSSPNSNPVQSNSDAANRVLLYYDASAGYFKSLTQRVIVALSNQVQQQGSGTISDYTFTPANVPLVPGSISVYAADEDGQSMAVTDNSTGNLVGERGSGEVNYTASSNNITVRFDKAVPNTKNIYISYAYYASVTHRPIHVCNFYNRLIMANDSDGTNYFPNRVTWSNAGDCTLVNDEDYSDRVDGDNSPIMSIKYQASYLVLYRQESVEKMRFVGGDATFDFLSVWPKGVFAGRTVANWQNIHLFLGKDDVYIFDGNNMRSIATERVRNEIFNVLNVNKLKECFGYVYHRYNEYWLFITRTGETYPTACYVYTIPHDKWSYFEFAATTCMGEFQVSSGLTFNELVGNYNEQNWVFDSGTLEGSARTVFMARYSGDVFAVDERLCSDYGYYSGSTWVPGSAIPIRLITRDFIGSSLDRLDRFERFVLEIVGKQMEIGYSTDYSTNEASFQNITDVTLTTGFNRNFYFPDIVCEHIRLLIRSTEQQAFALRWIQPFCIVKERD